MPKTSVRLHENVKWLRSEASNRAEQSRDHYRLASSITNPDANAIWIVEAESLAMRSAKLNEIANNIETLFEEIHGR